MWKPSGSAFEPPESSRERLEWHWGHPADRTARWKQFVKEGDIIQKGYITVTDRPGIGVEMNEEAVRKMARPGSPFFGA